MSLGEALQHGIGSGAGRFDARGGGATIREGRTARMEPAACGIFVGSGGSPASSGRSTPPASGTTSSSARVYGWTGSVSTCRVGPISTIRPRYITATRSAIVHANPRSCVTINTVIRDSRRSFNRSRRISPRTDASRFDTGSSATINRGSSASAPAMTTRCR